MTEDEQAAAVVVGLGCFQPGDRVAVDTADGIVGRGVVISLLGTNPVNGFMDYEVKLAERVGRGSGIGDRMLFHEREITLISHDR